jgi:hypothetical protein
VQGFAFFLWALNTATLYITVDACRGNEQPPPPQERGAGV